jgi:hypothetical protein
VSEILIQKGELMAINEVMKSKDIIILYLCHFIQSRGIGYPGSGLYIGITDNPDRRAQEHGIDINSGNWICYKCNSSTVAREIEA